MAADPAVFEMRRFETLSNTIFGVAMTLLAYEIPKKQLTEETPDWSAIWATYESSLLALLLGFIVAGMFWFSHQRRLAYEPEASWLTAIGNLLFLLSIVALPLSTSLYGRFPAAPDVIALYAFHLALISGLNLALWLMAALPRRDWLTLGAPGFVGLILFLGAGVSLVSPTIAQYLWCASFAAPAVGLWLERRRRRGARPAMSSMRAEV